MQRIGGSDMKILVERDRLKDALRIVATRTKVNKIPILTHILLDAANSKLRIVGHCLDSCTQVTIPAEVDAKGSMAIPCDGLVSVVAGLAPGSQVSIEGDDKVGKVKCGRSSYRFSLLPAADFPDLLEPQDPVEITLSPVVAKAVFDQPALCISKEESRHYLKGVYLHPRDKKLAGCATDGHTLALVAIDHDDVPGFEGVIVPEDACAEIAKLAGECESRLRVSRELIAVEAGDRIFISKLIDGTFPDFSRVIPSADAVPLTFDCKELDAALSRIVAAQDAESRGDIIKLSWSDNPSTIVVTLTSGTAQGSEEIECDVVGDKPAGETGLQCHYLRRLIEVTAGETIRLRINSPGEPIRIENPQNDDIVAVCMPCRV
jgi:DNA polymerase-3 subunit beta